MAQQIIIPIIKPIQATVAIPGSKSITNRALLLAALASGTSKLTGVLDSDDTEAMVMALRGLGIFIAWQREANLAVVKGCEGRFPNNSATIDCRESGIVARFLLATCAAMPQGEFRFVA